MIVQENLGRKNGDILNLALGPFLIISILGEELTWNENTSEEESQKDQNWHI